jgi:hypothetical protein
MGNGCNGRYGVRPTRPGLAAIDGQFLGHGGNVLLALSVDGK